MLVFCSDTKKRDRGRAWPDRQTGGTRNVSKQNASSVFHIELRVRAVKTLLHSLLGVFK
jgi:hypothetical protein